MTVPPQARWSTRLLAAGLAGTIALVGAACGDDDGDEDDEARGVEDDDFFEDPFAYEGEVISITAAAGVRNTGNVVEIISEDGSRTAFVVAEDDILPERLAPGDEIEIVGLVEEFDPEAVEEALDVDLDDTRFDVYVGEPVLIATSLTLEG